MDHRADLYSVGCLAYEALSGDVPLGSVSPASAFAAARINEDAPSLRNLFPALPAGLADSVMCLVARDPDGRPASARLAARALRFSFDQRAETARRDSSAEPVLVLDPPLVGRQSELRLLDEALSRAISRSTCVSFVIAGSPPCRPKRVIDAWLGAVHPSILALRAEGSGEAAPLAAFAPVVEQIAWSLVCLAGENTSFVTPRECKALKALSPRAAEIPGFALLPDLPPLSPDAAVDRQADAIIGLLLSISRTRPVILAFDAADQAGAATSRLLRSLAAVRDAAIMVVLGTTGVAELWTDANRGGRIELHALSDANARELVATAVQGTPGHNLLKWLSEKAKCQPDLVLDSLRIASLGGALTRQGGVVDLDPDRMLRVQAATIDALTVESLSADERFLGAALGLLGVQSSISALAETTRLDTRRVSLGIQQLIAARSIEDRRGQLVFSSASLPGALLASLGPKQRRTLTRRAARTAESIGDPTLAARLWLDADDPLRALPSLPAAAKILLARQEAQEAIVLTTKAIEHRLQPTARRSRTMAMHRSLRAQALILTGRLQEADEDLGAAEQLIGQARAKDPEVQREWLEALFQRARVLGRENNLTPVFETYLAGAEARMDDAARAFAHRASVT